MLRAAVPAPARAALRRAQAQVRAEALTRVPIRIREAFRLRSAAPLLARPVPGPDAPVLILSGAPMGDSGGGQRPAQLALALLERGRRVVFVHRFPSREPGARPPAFAHPGLTQIPFSEYSAAEARPGGVPAAILCEMPLPEFLACARHLRPCGARLVYDCIDDWDSMLGWGWYSRRTEDALVRESDAVAASARALQAALHDRSGRDIALLPNAVHTALFDSARAHPRPAAMPPGPVFLYVGALWGPWFDWDWVRALALARPEASVVLVGGHHGTPPMPSNVYLAGLLPQREVPAWVAHADVCLVPFRVDRLVEAVSPLKVFEYLAMGRPVAASDMPELRDLPWVVRARDAAGFVEAVARAQALRPPADEVARFAAANGWTARAAALDALLRPPACPP